ncbi:hypothetical protein [Tundra vole stool-associated circular virus]|nr:hypothetical protein [Tundra vole stool-associated circular virus]
MLDSIFGVLRFSLGDSQFLLLLNFVILKFHQLFMVVRFQHVFILLMHNVRSLLLKFFI